MAESVTKHVDDVLERSKVQYHVFPDAKTIACLITLPNGYEVLGSAACVYRSDYDEQVGKDAARANARRKVTELEGYRLADKDRT